MINKDILSAANVPSAQWDYCFINDNGIIFTPIVSDGDVISIDGKEMHQKWIRKEQKK